MHGIWKAWMTVWCWGVFAFGLVFAGAAWPATDGGARFYFGLIGHPAGESAVFDLPAMRLSVGIMGTLMLGWALAVIGVLRTTAAEPGLWKWITLGIAVWFAADSTLSVANGYPLNALANTGFFLTYLAPVLGSGVLRAPGRAAVA